MRASLKSGRTLEGALDAFRGTPERPFGPTELAGKFEKLTGRMPAAQRGALLEQLLAIDTVADVRTLPLA